MKPCPYCGTNLIEGAGVCTNCGHTFTNTGLAARQNTSLATRPAYQLKTNRGLLKYILLSILTFGIYGLVVMSSVSTDINTIASPHDGRKTMHFCLVTFVFSWLTLGIVPLFWYNNISERIGTELRRRNINYSFGAGTFWGWGFFGSLLFGIGAFVYMHKLLKSMNLLCEDYNQRG